MSSRSTIPVWLLLVVPCIQMPGPAAADDKPRDEAAIRELAPAFETTHNKHDTKAFAALFAPNGDLPDLIAQLAARGQDMQHRLISAGGASLRTHGNAGAAPQAIREGHYDYVVLQEQSTLPVKNAQRMHENVRLFDEAIKAAGAKTVLYKTWARQHAPEAQQAITDAYTALGWELSATVVPVGLAWQRFLRKHDQPVLHELSVPGTVWKDAETRLAQVSGTSQIGSNACTGSTATTWPACRADARKP